MKATPSLPTLSLTALMFFFATRNAPAVVGYYNVAMAAGWTLTVNHLKPGNADYGANSVLISGPPPDGSLLYRYDPAAQDFFPAGTFLAGVGWYPLSGNTNDAVLNLALGEGFFVWSPRTWTATIVGEVPQGALTNALPLNFSLKGSIVPQGGLIQTALGFPGAPGDAIWLGAPPTFSRFDFDVNDLMWLPNQPNVGVGQGFFVKRTVANQPWVRNFTVNRPAGPPPEPEPSPSIESFAIRDGIVTLKVDKVTKRYDVQYSADRENWTTIAANQSATTWRGEVPPGSRGFWQVIKR